MAVIKGNSEKTVCEYLLDLRTFFRFLKSRSVFPSPDKKEFEKITISDLTLDDVKAVKSDDIIEYLKEDEKNLENVERIEKYLEINGAKA